MPRELAESLGFSENSLASMKADRVVRWTGTWGDLSTQSYPPSPHHGRRRCGEHRADAKLKVIAEFRDWGRDCWCPVAS